MSSSLHINREVLRLALPSILANITIPLVGLVDTAIAGHISDASAIGGIAVGTMLFDLLYWNFGFLRVGTAGMTAQAWGQEHAGDDRSSSQTSRILSESVSIALWAALIILLLQVLFLNAVLWVMPCSEQVASFARQYFYIRVWAAPATLTLMATKGWFIGMQDTASAMIADICVNMVNIVASYVLAVHTPLGAMGVAWGTLIAQYTGLIVTIIILLLKYHLPPIIINLRQLIATLHNQLSTFYGQLFVRSLCFMVVYVGYTTIASSYGDQELAAANILMKLFMLFSYFIDGFAYAGEALTGRFIGARQPRELRLTVRVVFIWGVCLGILTSLVYWLAADPLTSLMTTDPPTLTTIRKYVLWLALMPVLSALAFVWDGIFVGACKGKEIRDTMIWAAISFSLTYLIGYQSMGTHALYLAYMMHLVTRTIYLSAKWISLRKERV